MNALRHWLAAASLLACAAAMAQPAKVIATATLAIDNQAQARRFAAELWFEAAAGAQAEDLTIRPPLRALAVARNAEPAGQLRSRPLIVLSHGNWGTRFSQGWLALELARAGYVVLSTSHPGTLGDDQSAAGRMRLWDRAADVSSALDTLLKHPRWSRLVDADRIGFAGHSFGGWTGISLAGGRYDAARQRAFCQQAVTKDFYCDGVLKDDVRAIPIADGAASFKDARIKAFYIMATGPGQGFSDESLRSISAPFIVDTAQFDEILEPGANSTALARRIASAHEILRPVGHFAYVPECKPVVGRLLTRLAGTPICDDPDGIERQLVHRQVAKDVLAFFAAQLKSPH